MKTFQEMMVLEGISGHEMHVKNAMKAIIEKYPNYIIKEDKLGSLFAFKKGTSDYTVMVAGHMDEVGMMVVEITSLGFLKVQPVGGLVPSTLVSGKYHIHTKKGKLLGYIGALPPHLKASQATSFDDLLIDIGATSKDEAKAMGVALGDVVTFIPIFEQLSEHRFLAKSVDNRYGVALALDMMVALHEIELPFNLAIGATVQEEVGLRGAETSVNAIKPDIFIALDASPVSDMTEAADIQLGKGFLLRMYDPRNTMPEYLKQAISRLAESKNIMHQYYISKGGTDSAKAKDMLAGVVNTTIGLPARYIHGPAAIFDKRDVKAAYDMLYTLLTTLDETSIKKLKEGGFDVFPFTK